MEQPRTQARVASAVTDYTEWISRSETVEDTASATSVRGLDALLDRASTSQQLFPLGHWLQFPPTAATSELGADGHPRLGGFMPPLPLPRRMWAGSRIEYQAPIEIGQHLSKKSVIESIEPKEGKSGSLCFVELRHELSANETLALTEYQTIVYRESPPVSADAPDPARPPRTPSDVPSGWDWSYAVQPTEIMLFRYSALTFNSHRIHYDLPYATKVERYPGLVVHGPLSATLIMDRFLQQHPNRNVTAFEFSARSPLFVNERAHVCGRAMETENLETRVEELAVIAPGGNTAITAKIEYR